MGLDMFAYKTKAEIPGADFDHPDDAEDLRYWRKHPNLHGWMETLYYSKGGKEELFNCVSVKLDAADIRALEIAVTSNRLPFTQGFFFGESRPEDKVDDLAFIQEALSAIEAGYSVFYSSWW